MVNQVWTWAGHSNPRVIHHASTVLRYGYYATGLTGRYGTICHGYFSVVEQIHNTHIFARFEGRLIWDFDDISCTVCTVKSKLKVQRNSENMLWLALLSSRSGALLL